MKKKLDFTVLVLGLLIVGILIFTSCNVAKNGYGCPKAKTSARHDKNLRF